MTWRRKKPGQQQRWYWRKLFSVVNTWRAGCGELFLSYFLFGKSDRVSRRIYNRADFKFTPNQWETSLQSNAVSHWLGANLENRVRDPMLQVRPTFPVHSAPMSTRPGEPFIPGSLGLHTISGLHGANQRCGAGSLAHYTPSPATTSVNSRHNTTQYGFH